MDDSGGNFSIQYSYNIDPIPNRCEAAEFLRYKTRNVHVYLNRWQHCNGFGWRWLLRTDCLNFLTNEITAFNGGCISGNVAQDLLSARRNASAFW